MKIIQRGTIEIKECTLEAVKIPFFGIFFRISKPTWGMLRGWIKTPEKYRDLFTPLP